ncbi:inositol monophosphatase family protein [Micromonospora wenchangensis]|uniref:inositol monophosphatase family protein n=1 Tax=Micromonospora wenchangensis TaxID=1185415 RepID=UPI001B807892|nr:inositol monophosphatase family protein [Micromonospora wenchangensis]
MNTLMLEIRPKLMEAAFSGEAGEGENVRHSDNFLSVHDMWMHERYRELMSRHLGSFVYASEEGEPQVVGTEEDPDLCVLVDPLDTSELAVRGLLGYTHVMIYSRALARPIVSVVGDIYHHVRLYVAARHDDGKDWAYAFTADGQSRRLRQRPHKRLSESLLTNFLMKPGERLVPLASQKRLMSALDEPDEHGKSRGRIGVDFGSVSLCHVAAGFTEGVLEFAKGFAIWDLAPGHYILHAAGGAVIDLDGQPVPLDYHLQSLPDIAKAMDRRQQFIAAGNHALAQEVLRHLDIPR